MTHLDKEEKVQMIKEQFNKTIKIIEDLRLSKETNCPVSIFGVDGLYSRIQNTEYYTFDNNEYNNLNDSQRWLFRKFICKVKYTDTGNLTILSRKL